MENWNSANTVLHYGKDGALTGPDKEHAETSMLALHPLQSSLVHANTLLLQQVLAELAWASRLTDEDRRGLTALFWSNVNPYGTFRLDMDKQLDLALTACRTGVTAPACWAQQGRGGLRLRFCPSEPSSADLSAVTVDSKPIHRGDAMSEGLDLAAIAVGIISAAATGTATTIGSTAGQLITDLVRARLQTVADGPTAVASIEDAPQDSAAQARLTDVLAQVLAADPAFRSDLASSIGQAQATSPSPPSNVAGNIIIGQRATAKGNFALRDLVVNRIRNTNNSTLAICAVGLIVFLALAIYGGTQVLTDNTPSSRGPESRGTAVESPPSAGSGQPGAATEAGHQPTVATLNDPALVKAILPDEASMPSGWTLSGSATVDPSCPGCTARVRYTGPASLTFMVTAHTTAADAKDIFDGSGLGDAPNIQLDMPAVGDQSVGTRGSDHVFTLVRMGTLDLEVREFKTSSAVNADDIATVEAVVQMFADRAQQAQNGQMPTRKSTSVNGPAGRFR